MKHTVEVQQLLNQLKQETALEMGIELGADQTAKMNGSVGGRMTQKLIELGQIKLIEMHQDDSPELKQSFYHKSDTSESLYLQ